MPKPLTKEEFIKKAVEKHDNKYDYSLVNYVNIRTKVKIICQEHGTFEQNPNVHLSGHGCSDCAGNKKISKEFFIKKAKELHGDKYDYLKVNLINNSTMVEIYCKKHNKFFLQNPRKHLLGLGCPWCDRSKMDSEEFIIQAKRIHGDKYDYSLSNYIKSNKKIKIVCQEHGLFEQTPNAHLSGHGCATCSGNKKLDVKSFIKKAKKIHADKYDYSEVKIKNGKTKVKIYCNKHEKYFNQSFRSHLSGSGCPRCNPNRKIDVVEFIIRAKKVHADKYDYSEVLYEKNYKKVKIICKKHNSSFWQVPNAHLRGSGCPKCKESKKIGRAHV